MKKKNEKLIKTLLKVVVIIILSVISFYSISSAFDTSKNEDKNKIYRYSTTKNVNYNVKLFRNNYIEKTELGMNQAYISKLIDNISAKLTYSYTSDSNADLSYNYQVKAKLIGNYNQNVDESADSSIWSKTFQLVNPTKKQIKGSHFDISEVVNVNYQQYERLVDNFIREVGIPISAYLDIELSVDITGTADGSGLGIKATDAVHLKMPVDEEVIRMTFDNNVVGNNQVSENNSFGKHINYVSLIFGLLVFGLIVFLVIKFVFEIFDALGYRVKHSPYVNHINKILNDYNDIIVEINTKINQSLYTVIEVKNFNEMMDLEEELRTPILCYSDEINLVTTFAVINNRQMYVFKIRESDFDK